MRMTIKEKFDIAVFTIGMVMFIDMCGFMLWIASGQVPVDNFYWGSITAHIAKFILSF